MCTLVCARPPRQDSGFEICKTSVTGGVKKVKSGCGAYGKGGWTGGKAKSRSVVSRPVGVTGRLAGVLTQHAEAITCGGNSRSERDIVVTSD